MVARLVEGLGNQLGSGLDCSRLEQQLSGLVESELELGLACGMTGQSTVLGLGLLWVWATVGLDGKSTGWWLGLWRC